MTARRYIKRVWRVPKNRGALDYFATLVVKALVKHGWPAKWVYGPISQSVQIEHVDYPVGETPPEFWRACEIAARIVSRTYRLETEAHDGLLVMVHRYDVTSSGFFKKVA